MNDALSGLIVAAVTAVVVAGIFYWTGRAKKRKVEALRALCVQRGWKYETRGGHLQHGHRITGDGWLLEAVSRSSGRETGQGSSDWSHSTCWEAIGENPGRGTFILGSRLGGAFDVSRLPPSLLDRFLGEEATGMRPFPGGERLESRYTLLAMAAPPAMGFLDGRAEDLLLAWPRNLPLVVRSSPARLSLTALNQRLEKPGEIAAFIELGLSLVAR